MAVYVDPFTGRSVESDVVPLGGPYPAIPAGTATYQGNPSDFGAAGMLPYGQGNPLTIAVTPGGGSDVDMTFSGGYGFEASRGATFYMPGDEWRIIASYGDIGNLQAALEAAGVLNGDYLIGSPDQKTADAMRQVLAAANASGRSWQEVLSSGVSGAAQRPGKKRDPLVVSLTSDSDLRAILQSGAQAVYGKYVSEDDVQKLLTAVHNQEAESQTAAYNAAATGGTVTAAPTTAGGVNQQFTSEFNAAHPTEARASIFSSKLNEILSAIIGPKT